MQSSIDYQRRLAATVVKDAAASRRVFGDLLKRIEWTDEVSKLVMRAAIDSWKHGTNLGTDHFKELVDGHVDDFDAFIDDNYVHPDSAKDLAVALMLDDGWSRFERLIEQFKRQRSIHTISDYTTMFKRGIEVLKRTIQMTEQREVVSTKESALSLIDKLTAIKDGEQPFGVALDWWKMIHEHQTSFHGVTLVTAQDKVGKSIFVQNIAWQLAEKGYDVLYLSTEMTVDEITERFASFIAHRAGITIKGDDDIENRLEAVKYYNEQPWKVDVIYDPTLTPFDAIEALDGWLAEKDRDLSKVVLIIDQFASMKPNQFLDGAASTRAQMVLDLVPELKKRNVPTLLVQQINRAPSHRDDKRPRKDDVAQTHELTRQTDRGLYLYRDIAEDSLQKNNMEVAMLYNRGRGGTKDWGNWVLKLESDGRLLTGKKVAVDLDKGTFTEVEPAANLEHDPL